MALKFRVSDKAITDTGMLRITTEVFDDATPDTVLLRRAFDFTLDKTKADVTATIKQQLAPLKDQLTGIAKVQIGDTTAL